MTKELFCGDAIACLASQINCCNKNGHLQVLVKLVMVSKHGEKHLVLTDLPMCTASDAAPKSLLVAAPPLHELQL